MKISPLIFFTLLVAIIVENIGFFFVFRGIGRDYHWLLTYEQRMPIVCRGMTIDEENHKAGIAGYSYRFTDYTIYQEPGWRSEMKR